MDIVVVEDLGVSREHIAEICEKYLPGVKKPVIYEDRATSREELRRRIGDADVLVEVNQPLEGDLIRSCKNLKLIAVAFAGTDHIDMEACRDAGVQVVNCPGYSAQAVAELVFGLLTAVQRNLIAWDRKTRKGEGRGGFVGREIGGKNFGIIGFGHIGKAVARIARAYGCRVFAYTRTPEQEEGVTFLSMEELLKTCDILSLHLPLTAESEGMIGKKQLAMMKKGSILINTARGAIVDSVALAKAVESGQLAGAGIDVFETEPPLAEDHVLLGNDRIVVTPHIGFATEEAFENRLHMTFQNIAAFFA